jgi:dTMP kinase
VAFLIDFEGIDGSGKGTQALRLHERLQQSGLKSHLLSFPRYAETLFGRGIADFLNGRFGRLEQVDPFLVSLLYAGDRFESKALLRNLLATCDVVVLDRYVPSNIAHQASKRDGEVRGELVRWIERIEYEIYGLPRPDLVLLLDMPPDQAQKLVALKAARNYTERPADIQEADSEHLRRTRDMYLELAAANSDWGIVACCTGAELRAVPDIANEIWQLFEQEHRG